MARADCQATLASSRSVAGPSASRQPRALRDRGIVSTPVRLQPPGDRLSGRGGARSPAAACRSSAYIGSTLAGRFQTPCCLAVRVLTRPRAIRAAIDDAGPAPWRQLILKRSSARTLSVRCSMTVRLRRWPQWPVWANAPRAPAAWRQLRRDAVRLPEQAGGGPVCRAGLAARGDLACAGRRGRLRRTDHRDRAMSSLLQECHRHVQWAPIESGALAASATVASARCCCCKGSSGVMRFSRSRAAGCRQAAAALRAGGRSPLVARRGAAGDLRTASVPIGKRMPSSSRRCHAPAAVPAFERADQPRGHRDTTGVRGARHAGARSTTAGCA